MFHKSLIVVFFLAFINVVRTLLCLSFLCYGVILGYVIAMQFRSDLTFNPVGVILITAGKKYCFNTYCFNPIYVMYFMYLLYIHTYIHIYLYIYIYVYICICINSNYVYLSSSACSKWFNIIPCF